MRLTSGCASSGQTGGYGEPLSGSAHMVCANFSGGGGVTETR